MAIRGRPAFQPTDEQRKNVEVMASLGIPEENIRSLVRNRSDTPISRNSLRKHFKKELEIGATKLNARVGHFMVTTILGTRPADGVTPIRDERVRGRLGELFLKSRLGWRENVLNQHEAPEEQPPTRTEEDVRREFKERILRLRARRNAAADDVQGSPAASITSAPQKPNVSDVENDPTS